MHRKEVKSREANEKYNKREPWMKKKKMKMGWRLRTESVGVRENRNIENVDSNGRRGGGEMRSSRKWCVSWRDA